MKKISIMLASMAVALGFSACNETWDDNPVLGIHEGDQVIDFLNVPEMANMSVDITEENKTETFHLTCSQPKEYGYAAAVTYAVELSLNEDFTTPAVAGAPASVLLSNNFHQCDAINPTYAAVAEAVSKMLDVQDKNQLPTEPKKLYVRLHSNVVNESGKVVEGTSYTSNVVSFEAVKVSYLAIITPDLPTGIYVRGGMNGWLDPQFKEDKDLDKLPLYEFLTTTEANTYELGYIEIAAGVEFKIADKGWGDPNLGIDDPIVFGEKAKLGWNTGNISLTQDFTGSITLVGSGHNWSVTFDALEPDTPGQASGIYLRGGMNDWGVDAAWEFKTTDFKGVWSLSGVTINAGVEFKVADDHWGDIDFGGAKNAQLVVNSKYNLEKGGRNIKLDDKFTGNITLRLKGGKYSITLIPD